MTSDFVNGLNTMADPELMTANWVLIPARPTEPVLARIKAQMPSADVTVGVIERICRLHASCAREAHTDDAFARIGVSLELTTGGDAVEIIKVLQAVYTLGVVTGRESPGIDGIFASGCLVEHEALGTGIIRSLVDGDVIFAQVYFGQEPDGRCRIVKVPLDKLSIVDEANAVRPLPNLEPLPYVEMGAETAIEDVTPLAHIPPLPWVDHVDGLESILFIPGFTLTIEPVAGRLEWAVFSEIPRSVRIAHGHTDTIDQAKREAALAFAAQKERFLQLEVAS